MREKIDIDAVKTNVAHALSPLLKVFHGVGDVPLDCVRYIRVEGCLERIIFGFGSTSLVVVADEDDDSVALWMENTNELSLSAQTDVSQTPIWEPFLGKRFGWGYVTVNQQGYCDGLLLGFGDIRPKILLQVLASSIHVCTISEVSQ